MVKVTGIDVGETGFGLMGLTWREEPTGDEQAFATLKAAIKNGATFWNGGEFYGDIEKGPNSLTLLNKYFTKYPEDAKKVTLSIKGGYRPGFKLDGSPEGIRASIDNCTRLLPPSVKKIDLYEAARVDKKVPFETTLKAIQEAVQEGKIGGISLSEVSEKSIRAAAKVATISAVEVEVSLWEDTYLKNGVTDACAELKIPLIAYSPLGRGFLTGQIRSRDDIPKGDFRLIAPRFSEENFPKNITLVDKLKAFADKKGCTPAQLALAWVRGLNGSKPGLTVLPIPGATKAERVEENSKIFDLTAEENKEIDSILKSIKIEGTRYPGAMMADLEG